MQQSLAGYAGISGIRLLERVTELHGELFASGEAVEAGRSLGLTSSHTYKLLHELARSGYIRRLAKGFYAIQSPLAGGVAPHTFAIATRLVRPSAISHWSALHHWGLVEQVPFVVTASTPKVVVTPELRRSAGRSPADRRQHAAWVIDGIRYEFIRIRSRDMFGIEDVWVDSRTRVPMFDKERALLDTFVQLKRFGAGGLGEQILAQHADDIDGDKLLRYAETMERPKAFARVKAALARHPSKGDA